MPVKQHLSKSTIQRSPRECRTCGNASSISFICVEPPQPAAVDDTGLLSTNDFACALSLRPQSIRKRFNQTGSYFGLKPVKLPNGRLYWPSGAIVQLQDGGAK